MSEQVCAYPRCGGPPDFELHAGCAADINEAMIHESKPDGFCHVLDCHPFAPPPDDFPNKHDIAQLLHVPTRREHPKFATDGDLPAWGEPLRYLTDDRDEERRNELVIMQGGNGDWYVSIVPEGEGTMGRGVRICTSGGAARAKPGLGQAIAAAYRALRGEPAWEDTAMARQDELAVRALCEAAHALLVALESSDLRVCKQEREALCRVLHNADMTPSSLAANAGEPADLRALAEEITRATKRAIDCEVDATQCISENDYHEQCITVGTNAAHEVLSRHFGRRSE